MINNQAYSTTKVSSFMANYGRELRMGVNLRKKEKMEKMTEFAKRMRKVQKEVGAVLTRTQEEMKRQVDRRRKETKVWKVVLELKIMDLVYFIFLFSFIFD